MKYATLPIKSYFGGKASAGTYQTIINQIPPHEIFISGFLGCDAILRHKRPAAKNLGFDLDDNIIGAWQNAEFPTDQLNLENLTLRKESFLDTNILPEWVTASTFIYLDPPYPLDSRKSDNAVYNFEMTNAEHERLLDKIGWLPCNVAISTYPNDLYKWHLKEWRMIEFQSSTRQGMATEWLFMNYAEPSQLHDYQYLGDNFKRREKIKEKFQSMTSKINKLTSLERGMLFNYLKLNYPNHFPTVAEASPVLGVNPGSIP